MSMDATAALRCRFCGRSPAVATTVRAHRGMIFVMQWRHVRGPFCRACGTQALKKLTTETLWQGWWGPISLVLGTPFALLSNLVAWLKIRGLPEPEGALATAAAPAAPAAPTAPVPGAIGTSLPPPPPPLGAAPAEAAEA